MTEITTYPLRLPRSLKKAVEKQSEEDGTSINQFVATAVAEKLSALQVAEFFADRKARADFKAFDMDNYDRLQLSVDGDKLTGKMGGAGFNGTFRNGRNRSYLEA